MVSPASQTTDLDRAALEKHRGSTPSTAEQLVGGLARFIYTHNPLYAASAWLVFFGLRASFRSGGGPFNSSLLTLGLAGYILLLAVTAYLVIRLGKVWDDVRSLLLLIVLMFLGLSVTFDGVLVANWKLGAIYCVGGWIFAAAVSEAVLRAIGLKLGSLLRLPYHALLALFFLYPLALAPWLDEPGSPLLQWLLFGFAPVGAAILLTLLPAVRRGAGYVANNGSPWPWPLFPWTLFFILAICISLRAYYLCISLHFVGFGDNIFGAYFLVPLGFAAAALLLEGGVASGSAGAKRAALWLPAAMVGLATLGHRGDPVYRAFLQQFEHGLKGSPFWVTLLVAIGFYWVAAARRVRGAGTGLTIAMLLLAVVAPHSLDFGELTAPRPWPLVVIGGVQLAIGLWERRSWCVLLGNCLLLAALTLSLRQTWFTAFHGALPLHLLLAVLFGAGLWRHDEVGRAAGQLGAVLAMLLTCAVVVASRQWLGDFDPWIRAFYPPLLAAAVFAYSWLLGDPWCRNVALIALAIWGVGVGGRGYLLLRPLVVGLDQMALGLLLFALAMLISLRKAGWWRQSVAPAPAPTTTDGGMPEGP